MIIRGVFYKMEAGNFKLKKGTIRILILLLLAGLIAGFTLANVSKDFYINKISSMQKQFEAGIGNIEIDRLSLLQIVVGTRLKTFLFSWIICVTTLGVPYVIFYLLYQGFSLGFLLFILINQYKIGGILIFLSYFIPQALLFVPVMAITLIKGVELSTNMKQALENKEKMKYLILLNRLPVFLLLLLLLFFGCFLEAYVNPKLMNIVIQFVVYQ